MRLTDDGATIQDVKTELNDCGVACSVRRLDPTQLLSCRAPLIVHVNQLRQVSSEGHFLIVTDIGTDGVQTFDPYANRVDSWKWSSFSDVWTGFAVVPEPSSAARASGLALAAALAVHILAFVGLLSSIPRGVRRSLPSLSGQGRDVARAVLIIVMSGLLASPAVGADEALRAASNDGINAAALLGGICGAKIAPGRSAAGGAYRTLEEVQSLLADYGVASRVRRLTYDDLIHHTGPCILPLRYTKEGSGNFYVMIYANSDYVTVVHAGLLLVTTIPPDEFRRLWTGHAILPVHDDPRAAYLAAAAGAAVIPSVPFYSGGPPPGPPPPGRRSSPPSPTWSVVVGVEPHRNPREPGPCARCSQTGCGIVWEGLCSRDSPMCVEGVPNGRRPTRGYRGIKMKTTRVVLLVLVVLLPASSRADAPALPDDVRAALEKSARGLDDLLIAGTRSRRMLAPAEKTLAALGTHETEAEFTQWMKFELRLQGAKIYESFRFPPSDYRSGNGIDEHSYNGTKYFFGAFDPGNTKILTIKNPAVLEAEQRKSASQMVFFDLSYLLEAGFSRPNDVSGRPIQSLVLARAAAGRIESVKDVGRDGQKLLEVVVACPEPWASQATAPVEKDEYLRNLKGDSSQLQMRIERERRQQLGERRLSRFLLDGGMGYAVREEWESRAEGGAVMFHTTNSDFQQVEPGGVWLPRRCEVVSHAYDTAPRYTSPEPLYATDIRVEKLERTRFGDEQFRIWYDHPGIPVEDYTDPKAAPGRPYTYVTTTGKPLEVNSSFASRRWLVIVGVNALLAVVVAFGLYVRSSRKVVT
jgi:hypothetical protein